MPRKKRTWIETDKRKYGCITSDVYIPFATCTTDKIKFVCHKLLKGDIYVVGYDHDSKKVVPSKILGFYLNGRADEHYRFNIGYSTLTTSPNCLIYEPKLEQYIEAKYLTVENISWMMEFYRNEQRRIQFDFNRLREEQIKSVVLYKFTHALYNLKTETGNYFTNCGLIKAVLE